MESYAKEEQKVFRNERDVKSEVTNKKLQNLTIRVESLPKRASTQ